MEQRGLAASTIDRRLSTVCGFHRFAHIDGRIVMVAAQPEPSIGRVRARRRSAGRGASRRVTQPAFGATSAGLSSRAFWDAVRYSGAPSRSPTRARCGHRPLRRIVVASCPTVAVSMVPVARLNLRRQRKPWPTDSPERAAGRQRTERVRPTRLFTASRRGRARRARGGPQSAESPACGSCRATPPVGHREIARASARRAPGARSPGHRR
jgi:hypothetical protein